MGGSQHSEGEKEPQKQQELLPKWHGITSQKTQILIVLHLVSTKGYISTKVVSICSRSFYNSTVL